MAAKSVAVLIAVYNDQKGLDDTLRSIEANACDNLTVVVVDDGSKIPIKVSTSLPHHAIRLEKNSGCTVARNTGLDYILAQDFDYIAVIDAADIALNQRFLKQKAFLDNNPDTDLISSAFEFHDYDGKAPPRICNTTYKGHDPRLKRRMHSYNPFMHGSIMLRKELIRKIGKYDERYRVASDYELLFRAVRHGKVYISEEVLCRYIYRMPGSLSRKRKFKQNWNALRIRLRYFNPRIHESYIGLMHFPLDILPRPLHKRVFKLYVSLKKIFK